MAEGRAGDGTYFAGLSPEFPLEQVNAPTLRRLSRSNIAISVPAPGERINLPSGVIAVSPRLNSFLIRDRLRVDGFHLTI